jgi:hypothetical protein
MRAGRLILSTRAMSTCIRPTIISIKSTATSISGRKKTLLVDEATKFARGGDPADVPLIYHVYGGRDRPLKTL